MKRFVLVLALLFTGCGEYCDAQNAPMCAPGVNVVCMPADWETQDCLEAGWFECPWGYPACMEVPQSCEEAQPGFTARCVTDAELRGDTQP